MTLFLVTVRWNVAKDIVAAWAVTMPMAATIAAIFYALYRLWE